MKTNLVFLNFSIFFILFSIAVSNKCKQVKWKKFIALGDSNTEQGFGHSQWLSKIAEMFERKLDVINRGFSGYNSEHIRYFLKDILDEFDVESIAGMTILLGTNDSVNKTNTLQHVPLKKFKENMELIIKYLISKGIKANRIILISPPRIDDRKLEQIMGKSKTYLDSLVKEYAQVCREIVDELDVLFLDLNKAMFDVGDMKYAEYLSDGIHFTYEGGTYLFEKLKPFLKKNIAENVESNYPQFTNLNIMPNNINSKEPSIIIIIFMLFGIFTFFRVLVYLLKLTKKLKSIFLN